MKIRPAVKRIFGRCSVCEKRGEWQKEKIFLESDRIVKTMKSF
jgi:hypothetical protein